MKQSEKTRLVAGFVIISTIWGSTWLAIKIGLQSVPPFFGVAIRFTVALFVLFILVRMRGERLKYDRASLLLYVNLGVLSFSFPFALVYWGEQYVASGLASVLFAAYPFVVGIASHLILREERLNASKFTGIVLGFIGVCVIFSSDIDIGGSSTLAMGGILLSAIMQGSSLVVVKRWNNRHISPAVLSLGGIGICVFIMYILAFSCENISDVHLDTKGVGCILYLGTFGSVVTFVTYYWLLERVEAVYLSLVSFVTPILAVILGAVLLHEVLSPRIFAGSSLVLLGILIANGKDLMTVLQRSASRYFSQSDG